jgi:hypothetical protein
MSDYVIRRGLAARVEASIASATLSYGLNSPRINPPTHVSTRVSRTRRPAIRSDAALWPDWTDANQWTLTDPTDADLPVAHASRKEV